MATRGGIVYINWGDEETWRDHQYNPNMVGAPILNEQGEVIGFLTEGFSGTCSGSAECIMSASGIMQIFNAIRRFTTFAVHEDQGGP